LNGIFERWIGFDKISQFGICLLFDNFAFKTAGEDGTKPLIRGNCGPFESASGPKETAPA
jgi:hypothetical protein